MAESIARIAILASGDRETGKGGSTAARVVEDSLTKDTAFKVGLVVCNNAPDEVRVYSKIDVLNRLHALKGDDRIEVVNIGPRTHPKGKQKRGQTLSESAAICKLFEERSIEFAPALGYLRVITGQLLDEWCWKPEYAELDPGHNGIYYPNARIPNNHPAILPFTADTHGMGAHQRAIDLFQAGRITHTAMTWHMVAAGVDTGPIIHEIPVPILPEYNADMLSDAVQDVEKAETSNVLSRHLLLREQHLLSGA